MVFELNARQRGKSAMEQDLLERALDRGRRVLVVRASGNCVYQRHGHLTSITPMREQPLDLWIDECATFERFFADAQDNDLPSPATIVACKRMMLDADDNDDPPPPRAA